MAANDLQGNSESKSQSHPCCNTTDLNDFSPALTIAKVPTAPSNLLFEMCLREECQVREKKWRERSSETLLQYHEQHKECTHTREDNVWGHCNLGNRDAMLSKGTG